jgi:hypothetical protein
MRPGQGQTAELLGLLVKRDELLLGLMTRRDDLVGACLRRDDAVVTRLMFNLQSLADAYEDLLKEHGKPHQWGMRTVEAARDAYQSGIEAGY